jgi:hypothetical protein
VPPTAQAAVGKTPATLAALLADCLFGDDVCPLASPGGGGVHSATELAVETAVLNSTAALLATKLGALPPFSRLCVLRATLTSLPREALFMRLTATVDGPPWTLLMTGVCLCVCTKS